MFYWGLLGKNSIFFLESIVFWGYFKLVWVGGWVVGLIGIKTSSAPNLDWGLGLSLAKRLSLFDSKMISLTFFTL